MPDRHHAIGGSAHPLARRKTIALADLAGADWILPAGQHLAVRALSRFSPVCRELIAELRMLCRQLPGRT